MILSKCSLSCIRPFVSKNLVSASLKAAVTTPISNFQNGKSIKPVLTQLGSQSSTLFYPKLNPVNTAAYSTLSVNADLEVTTKETASPAPLSPEELSTLVSQLDLAKVSSILDIFLELNANTKGTNKYRWSDWEKTRFKNKLNSMQKEPRSFRKKDFEDLSGAVVTRSPMQCYYYLRYHYL